MKSDERRIQNSKFKIRSSQIKNGVVGVIPARYASTRFPGKVLVPLAGKPVIQHVYERARKAGFHRLLVATDDERIRDVVKGFDGEVAMTSSDHLTGTDRVAEVIEKIPCEFTINIQGDEPLLSPKAVRSLIAAMEEDPNLNMATLITTLKKGELENPSIVKVILDPADSRSGEGSILSFSRSTKHEAANPDSPFAKPSAGRGTKHEITYIFH
ncbi:NTP transferase domain-containing protein [candidate division TA06 bacterium]|nr:NTP transferase domain-containing protein [candidate division TA06 bacterium]